MKRAPWFLLVVIMLIIPDRLILGQGDDETFPALPGRIAYIGADFNVYSLHPQLDSHIQLTDDGSMSHPYLWPTWSTDGRLAYFLSAFVDDQVATEVYVSGDGNTQGVLVYTGDDEIFTYAYWSPQNCDAGENCRDLAVLLSLPEGLKVELVRDSLDGATTQFIGSGVPFYYSWSPDGDRMLWQRNNRRVDIYDVASNRVIDTLPQEPGAFFAPAWSPVDDRLLFGALDSESHATDLVIVANGESRVLAPNLEGIVYFAWSPDGNKIAYTSQEGPLYILDAITGETIVRTGVSGVLAFFWSPDSNHIAYITLATPPGSFNAKMNSAGSHNTLYQGSQSIAWSVLDIPDGATRRYGAFVPTQEMLYLLIYFDQFSQSHRVWSPDSRFLLYSETTSDAQASINILDTAQADIVPLSIADGFIGVWSFN